VNSGRSAGTTLRCISSGFTLLEVLVAVVIIGLGMMAVFDQLNQMISVASRLRDKTFANWIAEDRITELQVNGEYPKVGEQSDQMEMANAEWAYTIKTSQIPDMELRRVDVSVSFLDSPDDILAELSGFVTPAQVPIANSQAGDEPDANPQSDGGDGSQAGTGFGAGFTPLDPNAIPAAGNGQ
jgi:general secretion pathway protein I